jgi:hypothetical protein
VPDDEVAVDEDEDEGTAPCMEEEMRYDGEFRMAAVAGESAADME